MFEPDNDPLILDSNLYELFRTQCHEKDIQKCDQKLRHPTAAQNKRLLRSGDTTYAPKLLAASQDTAEAR